MNIYPDAIRVPKTRMGCFLLILTRQGHLTAGCDLEILYIRSDFPLAAGRVLVSIQAEMREVSS
jgi:hypothetical protein